MVNSNNKCYPYTTTGGGGTKSGSQRAASSSQPVNWKQGTVSMLTVMEEDVKLVLISNEM